MDDQELKRRILELLSSGDLSKQQIKEALFIRSDKTLNLLLKELQAENLIYRHGAIYSITKPVEKPKKLTNKKKPTPISGFSSETLLRIMFALVGLGTTIVGIRNTAVFTATVFPVPFCYILSGVIALFMIGAVPAVIYLWGHGRKPFACVLTPIWLVVTLFSMFCTIEGMYSIQKDNFIEAETVSNIDTTNKTLYTEYENQAKAIQNLIDTKQITLDRYNKEIAGYGTQEAIQADLKNYNRLSTNIAAAEKFIQGQTAELAKVTEKKTGLLSKQENKKIVVKSFYERIEEMSGIKAFLLQFIVNCFAAIILDILGPISMSLAMYLKKE